MFLKSLVITTPEGHIIREIKFHKGLNLIVDETDSKTGKETGNSVGKTTVLKLIDFCLGGSAKEIYSDTENQKNEYSLVKDFLINKKIQIELTLKENLDVESSVEYHIKKNFLPRKQALQSINGKSLNNDEFEEALTAMLFPSHYGKKPTIRQIISHNIRYKGLSLTNTLKSLNKFTKNEEYEALYLFLLGCKYDEGEKRQELLTKIKLESNFKARLQKTETKSAYESALSLINDEIDELEKQKISIANTKELEEKFNLLNEVKYQINLVTSEINRLSLRKSLILEAKEGLEKNYSKVDLEQLKTLYEQATSIIGNLHKTFEDLNYFHNQMIANKIRFITQELPDLEEKINQKDIELKRLLDHENELSKIVTQSDAFESLENLITALNQKYHKKGELESILRQLYEVDEKLDHYQKELSLIDNKLFSKNFSEKLQEQIEKFNRFFSLVSYEMYGEKYALKADPIDQKGQKRFEFSAFNTNFSSGKKLGEISCFDIAYTLFADAENIPCFHFLLNDKKELMHDNQLIKIADFVNKKDNIQFVASILHDKLPEQLNKEEFFIVKLSNKEKLFRIENNK